MAYCHNWKRCPRVIRNICGVNSNHPVCCAATPPLQEGKLRGFPGNFRGASPPAKGEWVAIASRGGINSLSAPQELCIIRENLIRY